MIKFLPLGGADEIGSSCYYLNIEGTGIILDCGMHPRKYGHDALPKLELIENEELDFAFITHAHQDHIGALPYLVQKHPYLYLFSTPQTRAVSEIALHSSASILRHQLKNEEDIKPYSHDEVDLLIRSINYKSYNESFEAEGYRHFSNEPVKVTFSDAGHIIGSAGIMLEHNGHRIFYSGDINLDKQNLLPEAELPLEKPDTLIIESTYGATESALIPPLHLEIKRFVQSINRVLESGGSVLIPVFSLGKMQEILTALWNEMQSGRLLSTDIFTGGVGRKISNVYDYNRYVVRRIDPEFELSSVPQKDIFEIERTDYFRRNPSIVLASSGMMLPGTLSFRLGKEWAKYSNFGIFTVGYMDPDTPGYRVAMAKKGDYVKFGELDEPVEIKCTVKRFRFTAHARREKTLELVRKLKPGRVILVHGDEDAVNWLGHAILKENKEIKVYAAQTGRPIYF